MVDLLDRFVLPGAPAVVDICDPLELDTTSTMTRRLASNMRMYRYKLLDRSLLGQSFEAPITRHTTHDIGNVLLCNVGDRFATQLDIGDGAPDEFCFSRMIAGSISIAQSGYEVTSQGSKGVAFRVQGGTRMMASDQSGRANVWVQAGFLERALETLVGARLQRPLQFRPDVDWDRGLAASVAGLFGYLTVELGRVDGLASNKVALTTLYDALARSLLLGLPNSYSETLPNGSLGSVPRHVKRADDFMRAHAADAIRMEEVATAAGCSVRTLETAYRRFRDTTPLAALHAIRLDKIWAELRAGDDSVSADTIALRYGFTNRQRFRLAYERRFGHLPPTGPKRG